MQNQGIGKERANNQTTRQSMASLVASLTACGKQKDLIHGRSIHADVLRTGLLMDNQYIGNALVDVYAKCGEHAQALEVFDELQVRDVVCWTALIAGYTQHGHTGQALICFEQMQNEGLSPNAVTYTCILRVCSSIGAAEKGKAIHTKVIRDELLRSDPVLGTALLDMYGSCGEVAMAQHIFDELPIRDVVSWNALIAGYAQHGNDNEALNCYEIMQSEGHTPNASTFTCVLKACAGIVAIGKGQRVHAEIARRELMRNNWRVGNALLNMYVKCGDFVRAQGVFNELPFRDLISWTAMIAGYTLYGQCKEALDCFEQMQNQGLVANPATYTCILKACSILQDVKKGEEVHAEIVREGLYVIDSVLGTALIDMYAKCGALVKAEQVFEELDFQCVPAWNALIAGYTVHMQSEKALSQFENMRSKGITPDTTTYSYILCACGSIRETEKAEKVYVEIAREGLVGKDFVLGTSLMHMYTAFGALGKAQEVFNQLPVSDVVSWNAMLAGYIRHRHSKEAMRLLDHMQSKGPFPDTVTYTCMVDLLHLVGISDNTLTFIKEMPCSDEPTVWLALMSACQSFGNMKVGKLAFEYAVQLDGKSAVIYAFMSNAFSAVGMEEAAESIESIRIQNEAWKKPARCWLTDMAGDVHSFCVGDRSHSETERIHLKLEGILQKVFHEGYCPSLHLVHTQDIFNEAENIIGFA